MLLVTIEMSISMKDLTTSNIDRQNILNNRFAVEKVQSQIGVTGMLFNGEYLFTKQMVADFYEVDTSTIDRYLSSYGEELKHNGYILCKGKSLKEFKLQFAHLINEASKTTQLGLFNFRAFLNIGMLLTESDKAKQVRSIMLDLVISTINEKQAVALNISTVGMSITYLLLSQKKITEKSHISNQPVCNGACHLQVFLNYRLYL